MNGLRVPFINGAEPAWANLKVNIAGFPEDCITAIDYEDDQEMENVYGAGQSPIRRGYGNIKPKASISVLRSALEGYRASSDTGRLQDIAPFDIVVAFIPMNGSMLIKHKIRNCQFTKDVLSIKQGDTKNETTCDLIISSIEWK